MNWATIALARRKRSAMATSVRRCSSMMQTLSTSPVPAVFSCDSAAAGAVPMLVPIQVDGDVEVQLGGGLEKLFVSFKQHGIGEPEVAAQQVVITVQGIQVEVGEGQGLVGRQATDEMTLAVVKRERDGSAAGMCFVPGQMRDDAMLHQGPLQAIRQSVRSHLAEQGRAGTQGRRGK